MLTIKSVTMRNFMSVGNVTQSINLNDNGLTLILGDNVDQGSNGNRNGAGKTVILHAISYALFGVPMTSIKRDNLINKTNNKNMLVTIEFEKTVSGIRHNYKIERGRKPTHFKYIVDNNVVNEADTDEAQGDSRITQEDINEILGFSPLMFKHIIGLSTKTIPFLNEKANVQREMIEELLGITQLSQKAEVLKELIRQTRAEIEREEYKVKLIQENNEKTKKTIDQLKLKSSAWSSKHRRTIDELQEEINQLMEVDITNEIEAHRHNDKRILLEKDVRDSKRNLDSEENVYNNVVNQIEKLGSDYNALIEHKCHACGQPIHDSQHQTMLANVEDQIVSLESAFSEQEERYKVAKERLDTKEILLKEVGDSTKTFYNSVDDAYDHRDNLNKLIASLEKEVEAEDPYLEQIDTISNNNIQEVNYDALNQLVVTKDHQEFLLKLLTDKNSWVRKQIIEQNLGYLNHRLDLYLQKLGLPHQVKFLSDLSVEIMKLGQDFDFDNLSTGESTRLILALSWSFRDVFEQLNFSINLMFIDELIDNGMDLSGGESSLAVLKYTTREFNKNIFLISHKDEFIARVQNVLMVVKENGFTTYTYENDIQA